MAIFHKEDFVRILAEHDIHLNDTQQKQFALYAEMLMDWNKRINLTAICEIDAIYEKHFLDSLLAMLHMPLHGSLCDVGAGAGFPSLPMKIVDPSLQVTIIEPIQKRITFLRALCDALGLNVTLIHGRSEDYAKTHRECFDIVTARAVANLPILSELCIPLVKRKGMFLAMKGANAANEQQDAAHAIQILGCQSINSIEQTLSDGAKRVILVYEKIHKTPNAYPRAFAQIKKHPL